MRDTTLIVDVLNIGKVEPYITNFVCWGAKKKHLKIITTIQCQVFWFAPMASSPGTQLFSSDKVVKLSLEECPVAPVARCAVHGAVQHTT